MGFHSLPELIQLETIIENNQSLLRSKELLRVTCSDGVYPIYSVTMGAESSHVPVVSIVGGIHGLERIGTQVVLAFLETLIERSTWDESIQSMLERVKIVFLPIMNPVGMHRHRRANGNGVDLMRNAPVEADHPVFMAGGQRISSHLPWYRGEVYEPMEREALALVDVIQEELFDSPFSIVIDCHSGFGMHDRIWFPYACTHEHPIPHVAEMYELRSLLLSTYPNLNYVFEPQSQHYSTHGDLWDYMYGLALEHRHLMLPLTLELGSWLWVKKNPLQIRSALGMFHPIQPHRIKRVLRHHQVLFEFLLRAARSHENWLAKMDRARNEQKALALWYPDATVGWHNHASEFIRRFVVGK